MQWRVGENMLRGAPFARDGVHAGIVQQLCTMIAGASSLGHRTCHCLWGPPGCGKRRLLGAIRDRFVGTAWMQREYATITLETETIESDDDALAAVFEALRGHYLRQQAWGTRTFAATNPGFNAAAVQKALSRLFATVLPSVIEESLYEAEATAGAGLTEVDGGFAHAAGAEDGPSRGADPSIRWQVSSALSSKLFERVGTTALDALQRALVEVNEAGLSLLVLVTDIARFASRCDRVAYLLSGIMHECAERGGGVSLVCASESSDFALEKRLSSRLCCEVWLCPSPPLSTGEVLGAASDPDGLDDVPASVLDEAGAAAVPRAKVAAALKSIHRAVADDKSPLGAARAEVDQRSALLGRSAQQVRELICLLLTTVHPSNVAHCGPDLRALEKLQVQHPRTAAAVSCGGADGHVGLRPYPVLPREAFLLLCFTLMLKRQTATASAMGGTAATSIGAVGLGDMVSLIASHVQAEKPAWKLALYGEALDVLLERGYCALSSAEAIVLDVAESEAMGIVESVLASDARAATCGVSAERMHLRSVLGI
jgi:hypothetical protein